MKTWTPLLAAIIISVLINVFPLVMAFVLRVEGWAQTGWVFYLFTIPISAVLIIGGLIISLFLYFR